MNHYAFSERGGDLRVATSTFAWWERYEEFSDEAGEREAARSSVEIVEDDALDEEEGGDDDGCGDADTRLTVLRRDGDQLREVGVRAGLDRGEQ